MRRATAADVAAVTEVFLRSWDAALPTVARAHPDETAPAFFAGLVERAEVHLAVDGDVVVGFLALDGDWVSQLYLLPERRGEGIGSALLALAKARRPGGLQLWAFAVNGPARRFYERHGFVAMEHTDGSANEEREPDVRYAWRPA